MSNTNIMRIMAVGDLHLRKTTPAKRKDDYFETLKRKLEFILETAEDRGVKVVVFPGDVFDRFDAPYSLVEWAVRKFKEHQVYCFFVCGNHDLRYHTSDKANTPLGVLSASMGELDAPILDSAGFFFPRPTGHSIAFYGASWGDEPPVPKSKDDFNILVMHRTITNEPLPWDHKDTLTVDELKSRYPDYDVFITGDNHKQIIDIGDKQSVFNMGSVGRQTIAQKDHHPAVMLLYVSHENGLIDTKRIDIPIEDDVFEDDVDYLQVEEEEHKVKLFVESLQKEFDPSLSFIESLKQAVEKAPEGVKSILIDVLA